MYTVAAQKTATHTHHWVSKNLVNAVAFAAHFAFGLCVDFWTDMYAKSFGVKVIFSTEEMLSTAIVAFFDMYDAIMTSFSDCLYADMGSFRSKRQRLP